MISKISASLALFAFALQATAQSPAWGQCGGTGYTGPKTCVSGYTCQYSNEWYSQCLPGSGGGVTTTRAATTQGGNGGGGIVTPTKATTVFPNPTGTTLLASATTIRGVFDGKMARWDRNSVVCQDQVETGEKDAIFILEDGATLANVIIGKNQAEGVHCKGTCTLINVWHEDVCEDAVTFKQTGGTSYVIGGGARNASDKILQFNGKGKVVVKYFFASSFGKVLRHCGTCGIVERHSEFEGIVATGGDVVVGINTNAGDTTKISNSCLKSGTKYGDRYEVYASGLPTKIGPCPSGTACVAVNVVTNC